MLRILSLALTLLLTAQVVSAERTNLIEQIDANTIKIGLVRVEKKERRVIIPASVNMVEGPIEYVLVSALGKLHESILKTDAEPLHIHTAAMLFSRGPGRTNAPAKVAVQLEPLGGKRAPVEDFMENTSPDKSLKPEAWSYRGSRLVDGTFIAQRDGSIISIIADPDSLSESGRVSADDDENWRPKKTRLPALGTPVKVILTFSESK